MKRFKYSVMFTLLALVAGVISFTVASRGSAQSSGEMSLQNDVAVSLRDEGAVPDTITVRAGQTVQFNSADGRSHNLSLGKGGEEHNHRGPFASGEFGADEAWRVQFKQAGSYFFHDHYNPSSIVLVVVYE